MAKPLAVPLPRGWPRFAKSGLVHAVALARAALLDVLSGFENSPLPRVRLLAENERLHRAIAASNEEKRILRARLEHIPPARRPRYPPAERLAILTLRAAQGWNKAETARRLLVAPQTIAVWMKRLDDDGPDALVRTPVPVNRYPDFVALAVQKLRLAGAAMGRKRIANVLARAGLHLAPSTVRRMLHSKPVAPPPDRDATARDVDVDVEPPTDTTGATTTHVTAEHPHHLWHIDLTLVPTIGGLWVPWLPLSLATVWPSVWCICAVLDHFTRAPVAWRVFPKEPTAAGVCAVLDDAVERAGRAPRHIVSDKGHQFQGEYRQWCDRNAVKPRFGALGQHGSIAVLERFWRSLKTECVRRLLVPLARSAMEEALAAYMQWYIEHRPHEALRGATPGEVLRGELPAAGLPPFEPRARHPRARGDPAAVFRRPVNGRLELVVTPHDGSSLPARRRAPRRGLNSAASPRHPSSARSVRMRSVCLPLSTTRSSPRTAASGRPFRGGK